VSFPEKMPSKVSFFLKTSYRTLFLDKSDYWLDDYITNT
jgi:hypothetical protein